MKQIAALYLLFSCCNAAAQDSLEVLLSKEKQMFTAICKGDKQAAEKLFAFDYITVNADGSMQSRAAALKDFGKFKGSTFQLYGQQVRQYGNTAIINGKAKFYLKAIPVAMVFYTEIWVWRNTEWTFTGWQGTMTGTPSWYPVYLTAFITALLIWLTRAVFRKVRKKSSTFFPDRKPFQFHH